MSFWSKLFDPWGIVAPAWNNISGNTASFNSRQAAAKAQQAQEAQLAQQQAIARQQADALAAQQQATANNINAGRSSIDSAFAQFDEPYFANAAKSYNDYYTPQINQQEEMARDKLTSQLAGQGVLDSTVGANRMAMLAKSAADQRASTANSAQSHANSLRGRVSSSKDALYASNQAAADPNATAARATGEATTLANGVQLSPQQPVGDLFASLLNPVAAATTALGNSYSKKTHGVSSAAPTTGAGSSQVIG